MTQVTLESLAERIAVLEEVVQQLRPTFSPIIIKDWRLAAGTVTDSTFMREVDALGKAYRESAEEEE